MKFIIKNSDELYYYGDETKKDGWGISFGFDEAKAKEIDIDKIHLDILAISAFNDISKLTLINKTK